jgi:hypothetical protein
MAAVNAAYPCQSEVDAPHTFAEAIADDKIKINRDEWYMKLHVMALLIEKLIDSFMLFSNCTRSSCAFEGVGPC